MEYTKSTVTIFPISRKKGIGHDIFLIKSKREKMSTILHAELRKDKQFFLFFTYTNNRFLNLQNFKVSCKPRYLCSFSTLIFLLSLFIDNPTLIF